MDRTIKLTLLFLLSPIFLFAQTNQLGIGLPSISINDNSYSNSIEEYLFTNSEIYTPRFQTKKINSVASPILYYTRNISKKYFINTAISYQQENLQYDPFSGIIVEDPDPKLSPDYMGKFSQLKLNVGIGYHLIYHKKFKLYGQLALTNCFKTITEKWTLITNQTKLNESKKMSLYYFGFTPLVGFNQKISSLFSISLETGLEVNYSTNAVYQNILFWNPLNRLSLNYQF
jgi:hypothetical protein